MRIVWITNLCIQVLVTSSIYLMDVNCKQPAYKQVISLITSNLNSWLCPFFWSWTAVMVMSSTLKKWTTQTAKPTIMTFFLDYYFFSLKFKALINLVPFTCKSKLLFFCKSDYTSRIWKLKILATISVSNVCFTVQSKCACLHRSVVLPHFVSFSTS